uniref:TPR_REGION domain-containing protein n=1 Tax=Caenorhabditis tropicalis TaxID=1561998 RepID=A0A1I7USG4_9PELO
MPELTVFIDPTVDTDTGLLWSLHTAYYVAFRTNIKTGEKDPVGYLMSAETAEKYIGTGTTVHVTPIFKHCAELKKYPEGTSAPEFVPETHSLPRSYSNRLLRVWRLRPREDRPASPLTVGSQEHFFASLTRVFDDDAIHIPFMPAPFGQNSSRVDGHPYWAGEPAPRHDYYTPSPFSMRPDGQVTWAPQNFGPPCPNFNPDAYPITLDNRLVELQQQLVAEEQSRQADLSSIHAAKTANVQCMKENQESVVLEEQAVGAQCSTQSQVVQTPSEQEKLSIFEAGTPTTRQATPSVKSLGLSQEQKTDRSELPEAATTNFLATETLKTACSKELQTAHSEKQEGPAIAAIQSLSLDSLKTIGSLKDFATDPPILLAPKSSVSNESMKQLIEKVQGTDVKQAGQDPKNKKKLKAAAKREKAKAKKAAEAVADAEWFNEAENYNKEAKALHEELKKFRVAMAHYIEVFTPVRFRHFSLRSAEGHCGFLCRQASLLGKNHSTNELALNWVDFKARDYTYKSNARLATLFEELSFYQNTNQLVQQDITWLLYTDKTPHFQRLVQEYYAFIAHCQTLTIKEIERFEEKEFADLEGFSQVNTAPLGKYLLRSVELRSSIDNMTQDKLDETPSHLEKRFAQVYYQRLAVQNVWERQQTIDFIGRWCQVFGESHQVKMVKHLGFLLTLNSEIIDYDASCLSMIESSVNDSTNMRSVLFHYVNNLFEMELCSSDSANFNLGRLASDFEEEIEEIEKSDKEIEDAKEMLKDEESDQGGESEDTYAEKKNPVH